MKKFMAFISLLMLVGALSACTVSNPKQIEANDVKFSTAVENEAQGSANMAKTYAGS
jgi:hypothetical protein